MLVFQEVASEPIKHCDFVYPQGSYLESPYQTRKILDYLQIKKIEVKPLRNKYIVVTIVCGLSDGISPSLFISVLVMF